MFFNLGLFQEVLKKDLAVWIIGFTFALRNSVFVLLKLMFS